MIDKYCRTCLVENQNLVSLFNDNLNKILSGCLSVKISRNDKFPKKICQNCIDRLLDIQNFKEMCKKSEKKYMELLREESKDIKLNVTENAWKPFRLWKLDSLTDEDRKTENLYRKVRGVLNKLTPEKFDKLLNQMKAFSIDTPERLQGVINLIYEKAVDEPLYVVTYAKMCKELMSMNVPVEPGSKETLNFCELLLNRCREEFEKHCNKDETTSLVDKKKEIIECTDLGRKMELEDSERKIRRRSVGNVIFMGELYKNGMLTAKIMTFRLQILLDNKDEVSLECLCKLLSTIGVEMETQNVLPAFFEKLEKIVENKKNSNISSRIYFMIQDLIDLRKNKWVPRRQVMKPKTMDQLQRDAETELIMKQAGTRRKDDRKTRHKRPVRNSKEGNLITQPHRSSQPSQRSISKNETASPLPPNSGMQTEGVDINKQPDVPTITNEFSHSQTSNVQKDELKLNDGSDITQS